MVGHPRCVFINYIWLKPNIIYFYTLKLLGYCVCSELLDRIEYRFISKIVVDLFVILLGDCFI